MGYMDSFVDSTTENFGLTDITNPETTVDNSGADAPIPANANSPSFFDSVLSTLSKTASTGLKSAQDSLTKIISSPAKPSGTGATPAHAPASNMTMLIFGGVALVLLYFMLGNKR